MKHRHMYIGPWFNIKMLSYQYRKSHCGGKTVVRSSYIHNGISHTGKMSSLYWIGAQVLYFTDALVVAGHLNLELFSCVYIKKVCLDYRAQVTGPLWKESTGDWWFPSQRASNVETVSSWWCHMCLFLDASWSIYALVYIKSLLSQCWQILNWTHRNKLFEIWIKVSTYFLKELHLKILSAKKFNNVSLGLR